MALLVPAPKSNTVTEADISEATKDTFVNKTALNPVSYNDEFGMLSSYVSGANLYVDYYRRRIPYINKQTDSTTLIMEGPSADVSFDLIKQMEMKLEASLVPQIDEETMETSIVGSGIVYHGIKPSSGDIFFAKIGEDVGIFTVNRVTALSIHRGAHYKVDFHLYSFMDEAIKNTLNESVRETLYFDKQSFFQSDAALLTSESYNYLAELTQFRKDIINRYVNLFFDRQSESLIRPDGLVDTFLIEFFRSKVSIEETRVRVAQMSNYYESVFPGTIWYAMLTRTLDNLNYVNADIYSFQHHLWDAGLSSFDNRPIVFPVNSKTVIEQLRMRQPLGSQVFSYVFSGRLYQALLNFYMTGEHTPVSGLPVNLDHVWLQEKQTYLLTTNEYVDYLTLTEFANPMELTDLEYLVYQFLTKQKISQESFKTLVIDKFPYSKMEPIDKFYFFMIFLAIADLQLMEIN